MDTKNQINELNFDEKSKKGNNRNWLVLLHLSGILPLFFPTILIYNRKKATIEEMPEHFRAVIAFQATILFIWFLGFIGFVMSTHATLHFGILILSVIFSVINTLNVLNNKPFRYPFRFRFMDRKESV